MTTIAALVGADRAARQDDARLTVDGTSAGVAAQLDALRLGHLVGRATT
jgi:hypothetical protein